MEAEVLGSFHGLRWCELDPADRVELLALRLSDLADVQNPPKKPPAKGPEADARRGAIAEELRANGSSEAGIRAFMADLGI